MFCNLKMNYIDFLNVNKLAEIVMVFKTTGWFLHFHKTPSWPT